MTTVAVFSGGGVKGAFQVGALEARLAKASAPYDGFFGVSTGALTAAWVAQAKTLEAQRVAAQGLITLYDSLTGNKDIYISPGWLPLQLLSFLFGKSCYDPRGLRYLIARHINPATLATGAHFACGVSCLEDGLYHTVEGVNPLVADFILASASFPAFFPAVEIAGKHYVDGGVRQMTPLADACAWLKTQPPPYQLDVYLASPRLIPAYTGSASGVQGVGRALDMLETSVYDDDLKRLDFRNQSPLSKGDVKMEVVVLEPKKDYGSSLNFVPAKIAQMIDDGMMVGSAT